MATAKKQVKGAQPSAAVPVKKLTRKEKHVINSARWRKGQAEEIVKATAGKRKLQRNPDGKSVKVIHGDKPKPTIYDAEIGKKICLMFATDPDMNLVVLNSDPSLPTVWTFYEWLHDHPDLDKSYARAREMWCDLRAAQLDALSLNPLVGTITVKKTGGRDGDTTETRTHDNVDRARLAVETRKWLLAKERPKKYGVQPLEAEDGNDALQELLNQFRSRSQAIENAS